MKPRWPILPFVALTLLGAGPAGATDLLEVYRQAMQSDPLIREAEANLLAAQEAKPRARSVLLPQLNVFYNYQDQEQEGTTSPFDPITGRPVTTETVSDQTSNSTTFQLVQTVFRWNQFMTLDQAEKQIAQAEADYAAAQQDLMIRTAVAYFNVLNAEDIVDRVAAEKEAVGRQLEQSEKRFEVGLIAITDVKESQAAYDRVVADEVSAKRGLASAREGLRELTGTYLTDLVAPGADMPLIPPDPANENQWVEVALDQNVSLLSARFGADIARQEIRIRRSGHMPTLDLVATRNEFDSEISGVNTPAPTLTGPLPPQAFSTEQDFETDTILLQLNIPIYSGGGVSSNVREAVYQHRAAKERVERIARETERNTRDAFLGVESDISRVQALKRAVESSETALRATEAGFEVGTRTAVDVLDARRQLFLESTNYEQSRYDYVLNVLRLKQAAGTLREADVAQANSWISAAAPTEET